jgi:hypothetical protein
VVPAAFVLVGERIPEFSGRLLDRPSHQLDPIRLPGLVSTENCGKAIIFGIALAALTGHNAALGIPFAGLKLLVELGGAFATEKPPESDEGPRWLIWLMKKCFPKEDFAAVLRVENAKRRRKMADDELPQR